MSIGIAPGKGRTRRPVRRTRGFLPEPAPRTGAHGYAGKRVRDDVREGVLVMAFSVGAALVTAVVIAAAITVLARVGG